MYFQAIAAEYNVPCLPVLQTCQQIFHGVGGLNIDNGFSKLEIWLIEMGAKTKLCSLPHAL